MTVARSPLPPGDFDGDRVAHLEGDITGQGVPAAAVKLALDTFGRLDAVVINHGVLDPVAKIVPDEEDKGSVDEWRKCFDTNFFSAVELVREMPISQESLRLVVFFGD